MKKHVLAAVRTGVHRTETSSLGLLLVVNRRIRTLRRVPPCTPKPVIKVERTPLGARHCGRRDVAPNEHERGAVSPGLMVSGLKREPQLCSCWASVIVAPGTSPSTSPGSLSTLRGTIADCGESTKWMFDDDR